MATSFSSTLITILFIVSCNCDNEFSTTKEFRTAKTSPKPVWNDTTLDKLKKDLLMNYDKYARPEKHHEATDLRLGLAIIHVEVDELKSAVTVHTWLRMVWHDSKLMWNETDYGGLSIARIGDHEIWQPDVYLYNSISGGEPLTRFGNPYVLIYPNGEVLWVPPAKLTALCQFNLRYWPFDTQHCQLVIGSWTHSGNEIKLSLYNNQPTAELEASINCSAWNVTNTTAEVITKYYPCCPEPYYSMQINITLVRKSVSYTPLVITPVVVIALLILAQFWLPPRAEEKTILNGFIAITLIMFLIYFTSQIGVSGTNTPLIIVFYSGSLCMVCLSLVTTIAVPSLSKLKQTKFVPWSIKKHLHGNFGKWLLLEYNFGDNSILVLPSQQSINTSKFENIPIESQLISLTTVDAMESESILALAIDRIFFLVYSAVFLVLGIIYLV